MKLLPTTLDDVLTEAPRGGGRASLGFAIPEDDWQMPGDPNLKGPTATWSDAEEAALAALNALVDLEDKLSLAAAGAGVRQNVKSQLDTIQRCEGMIDRIHRSIAGVKR